MPSASMMVQALLMCRDHLMDLSDDADPRKCEMMTQEAARVEEQAVLLHDLVQDEIDMDRMPI